MPSRIMLNMIVKDEAHVIRRCLDAVRPWIAGWIIVDTGSRDGTQAVIREHLRDLPGELIERPWQGFGHNRTEAIQLACAHPLHQPGDYLLFIDADEVWAPTSPTPPILTADAYNATVRFHALRYDRTCLVSTRLAWRWVGVLHEYLEADQPFTQAPLDGVYIDTYPEGARSRNPDKYQHDAAVLEAALRDEPDNARYVFYLAQSYRDAGDAAKALVRYQQRAGMGGWDEEVWYSLYQVACLSETQQRPLEQVQAAYLNAYEARPHRAESLVALARYCRLQERWPSALLFSRAALSISLPSDRLFVESSAYGWWRADEYALACYYTGATAEAGRIWRELLVGSDLPPGEIARIQANLAFAEQAGAAPTA